MKQTETITEYEWRLKQQAKASKDNSKSFRYLANGINRTILNKPNNLQN